ncbi:MAG: sulfatase family protein [Candidatus Binatia bacterium]
MVNCPIRARRCLVLAVTVVLAVPSLGHPGLVWGPKSGRFCEPPSVLYSSRHQAGIPPCCATDDGACPGGDVCPPSGMCTVGGTPCAPTATNRPNVVLVISDDQGACHYGNALECRSTQTGTSIPAPVTPNVDALAAAGTVFPVAHNTASWCYPSLNSILTGRYQKSFGGARSRLAAQYLTIPRTLRQLGHALGTVKDPFDSDARIGGYCSLQAGKFTASSGRDTGFDARVNTGERKIGRIDCSDDPKGGLPLCGTDAQTTYNPFAIDHMRDVFQFLDAMVYKTPGGAAGEYAMQQFFLWYAPRIPHQPLRAPDAIGRYLFGADGQKGFFQLGQLCTGGSCPQLVRAFDENNFGTVREYYANVYLADANVGELRKFLRKTGEPHCIAANGESRFGETTPQACHGMWATSVAPAPEQNTIFAYLSDNGWQLPNSKHNFSENGYRTRLVVFDPRVQASGEGTAAATPVGGSESLALAHSTDLLPSVLGFALGTPPGTQTCPESDSDGTPCDGRDFRAQLASNPGGAAPSSTLRHALCGHETQRPARPGHSRYLLAGPGAVGRCALTNAPACVTDAECASAQFCLEGRCTTRGGQGCGACPAGTVCLGGSCQAGPPCIDDATCSSLLAAPATCVAKDVRWCANAPDVACTGVNDCPDCPSINGRTIPCRRLCEPRMLKMYDHGGSADMTDLFLDPDERDVHTNGPVAALLSDESGPYGPSLRTLACCIDAWWDGELRGGSLCDAGRTCPAELTCNE